MASGDGLTYWQSVKLAAANPVATIFGDSVFVLGLDGLDSRQQAVQLEVDAAGVVTNVWGSLGVDPVSLGLNVVTGRLSADQINTIRSQAFDSVLEASNGDSVAAQNAADEIGRYIQQHGGGSAEDEIQKDTAVAGKYLTAALVVAGLFIVWRIGREL